MCLCRIIRPPRKRGGHVLLDVCAEVTRGPGGTQQDGAAIVRHVVAQSDGTKWMGRAAYQLARSANWGDLWPAAYNQNQKQQVVMPGRAQLGQSS